MKCGTVVAVFALCLCCPAANSEPLEPWGEIEIEFGRLLLDLRADLELPEGDEGELTVSESLLVFSAADLRSPSTSQSLVRLLGRVRAEPVRRFDSGPLRLVRPQRVTEVHPAAFSLQSIGIPAARAMLEELVHGREPLSDEKIATVGATLRSILRWHTWDYVEWYRDSMPPDARQAIDRTLSLDVIKDSRPRLNFEDKSRGSRHREGEPASFSQVVRTEELLGTPNPIAKGRPHASKDFEKFSTEIRDWRKRTDTSVRNVLDAIPANSLTLTSEQVGAIETAGRYKVLRTVPKLMTLCTVRVAGGDRLKASGPLAEYPAGKALSRMGWNASVAIRDELRSCKGFIPQERLAVYALILREAWSGYAEDFVRVEQVLAPRSIDASVYEKLRLASGTLK